MLLVEFHNRRPVWEKITVHNSMVQPILPFDCALSSDVAQPEGYRISVELRS